MAGGAQLRTFPKDMAQASYKAAQQLYEELSDKSPAFKKINAHWSKFRAEQVMRQQFCALQILMDELRLSMKLSGAATLAELGPEWVLR